MTQANAHPGEYTRARSNPTQTGVTFTTINGEDVACVPVTGSSKPACISARTWEEAFLLGYRLNPHLTSNGTGRTYVATPGEPSGRSHGGSLTLARTLHAVISTRGPTKAQGFVVRFRDGDYLNLTDGNLVAEPAKGRRNSSRAVAGARERRKLVAAGLDPNRVFAERRRATREQSRKEGRS